MAVLEADRYTVPTRHWTRLEDGRLRCDACPRGCRLRDGQLPVAINDGPKAPAPQGELRASAGGPYQGGARPRCPNGKRLLLTAAINDVRRGRTPGGCAARPGF